MVWSKEEEGGAVSISSGGTCHFLGRGSCELAAGRMEDVRQMAVMAVRFGVVDVRETRGGRVGSFSKRHWLPNKRMQLTPAAVMPAAGHPACQPRRS